MQRTPERDPARGAPPPRPSTRRLWIVAPLAALAASVINAGLFSIGDAFGAFPADVLTPAGVPITLGAVLALTIAGSLGAAAVYALLHLTTALIAVGALLRFATTRRP